MSRVSCIDVYIDRMNEQPLDLLAKVGGPAGGPTSENATVGTQKKSGLNRQEKQRLRILCKKIERALDSRTMDRIQRHVTVLDGRVRAAGGSGALDSVDRTSIRHEAQALLNWINVKWSDVALHVMKLKPLLSRVDIGSYGHVSDSAREQVEWLEDLRTRATSILASVGDQ